MNTIKKPANVTLGDTENQTPVAELSSAARVWDRVAARYAAKPIADSTAYARKLELTRKHLQDDAVLLELGCGTGSTALAHAPYVKQIRAVDFSTNMINIAKDKASSENVKNVDFVRSDVRTELASYQRYDIILALSLLHLIEGWEQTISLARASLKPGGVLITSTPCLDDTAKFMRLITPLGRRLGLIPSLSFFSRAQLEGAFSRAGFELELSWQPSSKAAVFLIARRRHD